VTGARPSWPRLRQGRLATIDAGAVADPSRAAIDFRILGPIEAVHKDHVVKLGGRRQRSLLALLLLEPGRAVSADRLIDELWDGKPPAGAETTLRSYVSRLRSALSETAVVARPPGYVLDIQAEQLDAHRFERLLRSGREALARGAAGLAADRLAAALELWRGPALTDVSDAGALAREAERLNELRLVCLEERIEADLALGRHAEVVPELEGLVGEEPFRERFWRQLVVALYRCERQSEALAAYRRARSLLSDELGLEPSEELRVLERAVLRHEIPAAAPSHELHNLPAQWTSFIGRDVELAQLEALLRSERLVTVTGIGGAGKTRLALETAVRQARVWKDGVWLVDLAPVSDAALVATAVGQVVRVPERPGAPILDVLLEHLREAELLLVLDNCEHVVGACVELVHAALRGSAHVHVLATSRVALGIPGEVDYSLEPLPTPRDDATADEARAFPSVRLFLERGRAARRDLTADDEGTSVDARICRELDGFPLAIELAAARTRALSLAEIADRLDDRFRFLRYWHRVADPRHQTLRATIDWSYELLPPAERALFEQLSVFAGGFTLEAVAAVSLARDGQRALELVQRLVESSLVVAEDRDGATRYRLLETIRQYASERLQASGAGEASRRSHAEHFLDLARRASPDYVRFDPREHEEGLAALDAERDNVHSAMQWALGEDGDLALALAADLRHYWLIRGHVRQGLDWLERSLARSRSTASPTRAAGLAGAALLARLSGEFARAQSLAGAGLSVGRAVGTPRHVATCLNVLTALAGLAGNYERARAHCDEAVTVARSMGSRRIEAIALFILAEAALETRRYSEVRSAGERALELSRSSDDREGMALALSRLGIGALHEGRSEEAFDRLLEALDYAALLGFPAIGATCCDGLAAVVAGSGDSIRAARLLGAGETLRRAGGGVPMPAEAATREMALAAVRRELSDGDAEGALEAGCGLSMEQALATARGAD
jgi:predicted ATPase/DNA-binding SARP family transcriptional activator